MIKCADIIEKRRKIWNDRHDIGYDTQYIRAAARKIIETVELRTEIEEKPYLLIEIMFQIVNKAKQTVPFFLNQVQQDFIRQFESNGTRKPFFVLKGRQLGFTSLITAMQLCYAIVRQNFSGFTLADRDDNTRAIFNDKAKVPLKLLPDEFRPTEKANNAYELMFGKLNSSWRIATASNQVGRSRTLNFVHYSEVAFYTCSLASLQAAIGEATVSGSIVVYETTANGYNDAKELWDSAACTNLFYPWWWDSQYRSTDLSALDTRDGWLQARLKVLSDIGLDDAQRAWYAQKYNTYIDKHMILQEYPCSAEEAFVATGYGVFDADVVSNRIATLQGKTAGVRGVFDFDEKIEPIKDSSGTVVSVKYSLENVRFRERQDGYITLHVQPERKYAGDTVVGLAPYVLGGDTAGSGQDYFTGKVINNITGESVATLRVQRIDEDTYAQQMLCLAKYYNDALVAIETNYSRHPINVIVAKYGYSNVYLRQHADRIDKKIDMVYGFETTTKTKPIIIAELAKFVADNPDCENDIATLKEMLTFVKKDNGKQEAIDGAHDDLVMADAIAHYCGNQQGSKIWLQVPKREDRFLQDNFDIVGADSGNAIIDWDDF